MRATMRIPARPWKKRSTGPCTGPCRSTFRWSGSRAGRGRPGSFRSTIEARSCATRSSRCSTTSPIVRASGASKTACSPAANPSGGCSACRPRCAGRPRARRSGSTSPESHLIARSRPAPVLVSARQRFAVLAPRFYSFTAAISDCDLRRTVRRPTTSRRPAETRLAEGIPLFRAGDDDRRAGRHRCSGRRRCGHAVLGVRARLLRA